MKIISKSLLLISILMLFSFSNVFATEVFYTNANGVKMNELQYNKMLKVFSETKVESMSQEEFDRLKDANIVSNEAKYEKETYINKELVSREEITEEEFNNAPMSEITPYIGDDGMVETSYKRLGAFITDGGGWTLTCALSWKKKPAYQSYDVFAYRFNHFKYNDFYGEQLYRVNGKSYIISYTTSSEGYKELSNGAGVSMNLKDGSDITGYELTVGTKLAFDSYNYSQAHAYVSYQHAQANLTRAESMAYTLDITGLGNVVKFTNSATERKYDGMSGVHLIVPIA